MLNTFNKFCKEFTLPQIKFSRVNLENDSILSGSYIPVKSQEYIETIIGKPVHKISTDFIHIYTTSSSYKKLAKFCILFSSFFQKINRSSSKITLYYLPDPNLGQKTIKNINKVLSSYEINSGLRFSSDNTILVYRKEEAAKVIIHELIHAFELDTNVNVQFQNKNLIINSNVPIRFTETYTELLASILYTEYTRKTSRKEAFTSLFRHFEKQADKLMCIYGIGDIFLQDTHVFEYIIAKHAFCSHVNSLEKIVKLLESPVNFSKVLENALEAYISNFQCDIKSLPKKVFKA